MSHIVADRVKETTTTTGTGTVTLAGAVTGFRTFGSVMANGDTTFYCIALQGGAEWEVGLGTWATGGTLARTAVLDSSNAGAAVNFSAGTKDVFLTSPAIVQGFGVQTLSPSGATNDLALNAYANILRLTPSASHVLTGIAGGYVGRQITLVNASTDYLVLITPLSTASSAANRLTVPPGCPFIALMPGDSIALWYDGAASRWRLRNSSVARLSSQFDVFSDCTAGNQSQFNNAVTGTGASAQVGTFSVGATEKPLGILQVDTGTTATGRAYLTINGQSTYTPAQGAYMMAARLVPEALSNGTDRFQLRVGNHDGAQGTDVTDGVYWEYDDATSTDWRFCVAGASARTKATETGFTVSATNYHILGLFVNPGWTRADPFYSTDGITFTFGASATGANIPTSTEFTDGCSVGINKTVGTTQRNLSVDWMGYRDQIDRG